MRNVLISVLIFASVAAQSDGNGGFACNFPKTGNETIEEVVPISAYSTSGANSTRAGWCVAYCNSKQSIQVTALFQPSKAVHARYQRRVEHTPEETFITNKQKTGFPQKLDDLTGYCPDDKVYLTVDAVFAKYKGVDTLAAMLAKEINKPGWAYLVYQFVSKASALATTTNAFTDKNVCIVLMDNMRDDQGRIVSYQVFAGLVKND